MWRYLLKRCLLLVVTLFGITVVTFVITRAAPGNPALQKLQGLTGERGQQLSEQLIEDNLRVYGLDKPILLNFREENRDAHARELAEQLIGEDLYARRKAPGRLREVNLIAVPHLVARAVRESSPENRQTLLEAADSLVPKRLKTELRTPDRPQPEVWEDWVQTHSGLFKEVRGEDLPASFAEVPDSWFTERGAFSVPFLMEKLREPPSQRRAATLLSDIVGRNWQIPEDDTVAPAGEKQRVLDRWKRWWRQNREKYDHFTGLERWARVFTATQYGVWLGKILTFDFDESYTHRRPVIELIRERLPVSLSLSYISIFISYLIAVPLGVFSATHQHKWSDRAITLILFVLYSLPSFWVATMLQMFLTGKPFWTIFPTSYLHSPGSQDWPFWSRLLDWIWHLVLPVTCLVYASLAFLSRQMRSAMLEVVRQDFIRTARAKGLSERVVIFKHAMRNSLIPILTLLASLLPAMLGGSIIIEEIFTIRGMGQLSFHAIINRDYPVVNGIAFFSAALTLLGILVADVSYALTDPRIKFE